MDSASKVVADMLLKKILKSEAPRHPDLLTGTLLEYGRRSIKATLFKLEVLVDDSRSSRFMQNGCVPSSESLGHSFPYLGCERPGGAP